MQYDTLSIEWRKVQFYGKSGGYIITHKWKDVDNIKRKGTYAEIKVCEELAKIGHHVLRLPENVLPYIDVIMIYGKPYREFLKFKKEDLKPRGYPDIFFNNKTWDIKTSDYNNEESVRKLICDGRKADNVIFYITRKADISIVESACYREEHKRKKDGSWKELPDVYYLFGSEFRCLWKKKKIR